MVKFLNSEQAQEELAQEVDEAQKLKAQIEDLRAQLSAEYELTAQYVRQLVTEQRRALILERRLAVYEDVNGRNHDR